MAAYLLRRLLLVVPTLFGILLVNFILIQFVPGGPIEQIVARLESDASATDRITGGGGGETGGGGSAEYRCAQGLPPDFIADLEKQFGFDKPAWQRFLIMVWNFLRFDFGESYFRSISVVDLVLEKMPVSISLGLWSTLLAYLISIPLGIRKAVADGSAFDTWTSGVIVVAYAIPSFLFAILLIVFLAGGSYWQIFPLRGLTSDNWAELSTTGKILDYLWHITLPVIASTIGAFATLTLLTKNSFLEEIRKQYVVTARAKGLPTRRVIGVHALRNALIPVVTTIGLMIGTLLAGAILTETIFSWPGIGKWMVDSIFRRDYPAVQGGLLLTASVVMGVNLVVDLTYGFINPRIRKG